MATRQPRRGARAKDDLDIEWEDPPPSGRGTTKESKWLPYLREARKHPGKTMVLRGTSTSVATNIRHGNYRGIEKGEFEVTTRVVSDGKVDCYVKYIEGKKR